jgi:hypothetical protein
MGQVLPLQARDVLVEAGSDDPQAGSGEKAGLMHLCMSESFRTHVRVVTSNVVVTSFSAGGRGTAVLQHPVVQAWCVGGHCCDVLSTWCSGAVWSSWGEGRMRVSAQGSFAVAYVCLLVQLICGRHFHIVHAANAVPPVR